MVSSQVPTRPRRASYVAAYRQARMNASCATSSARPGVLHHLQRKPVDARLVAAHEGGHRARVAGGHARDE